MLNRLNSPCLAIQFGGFLTLFVFEAEGKGPGDSGDGLLGRERAFRTGNGHGWAQSLLLRARSEVAHTSVVLTFDKAG
jgi:hypothetical protein